MAKLTEKQADSMLSLGNYVGRTVDVMTSEYARNVNPEFVRRSVGLFNASTLRGLERKGFIRINQAMWRGANITVLRAA